MSSADGKINKLEEFCEQSLRQVFHNSQIAGPSTKDVPYILPDTSFIPQLPTF